MKYRIGSVTIEAIDTYVRVTVANIGGIGCPDLVQVTKSECPSSLEVAQVLAGLRGMRGVTDLDRTMLQACGRAADDARDNRAECALCLD